MEEFPKRVIQFDTMLKSPRFSYDRIPDLMPKDDLNIPVPEVAPESEKQLDPPSKKRKVEETETNKTVNGAPVYGFIRGTVPCNQELAKLMDEVRPLLREAVESVNKVRNVESEAASFLDQMSRYFTSRGKLLTKVAKYPHVEDYRRGILDMDEKQFINVRLVILEVRNHYSTLHDIITKNLEKIKTPRTSNMEHLY